MSSDRRVIEAGGGKFTVGDGRLALIAGPCVVEELDFTIRVAEELGEITAELGMAFCFKASYDKANRSTSEAPRGPGWQQGLEILALVKERTGLPVLTDVHESIQVEPTAQVVDVLQIPAFLVRQTDLLVAAGATGLPVNLKKGQFLAPEDMQFAAEKVTEMGNPRVMLTERGTVFGYHNLVVDMRSLPIMAGLGYPVLFDATHSVQLPSVNGARTGGQREFVEPLIRAAVAVGLDGLFVEVHPCPDCAPCDGTNMLHLADMRRVLRTALRLHEIAREARGSQEPA